MRVIQLQATNFRNFASLRAEFGPGVNVLYGRNGSGKTNLLEAIFTLSLGRSQRAARDNVLIKDGEDYYRIEGEVGFDDSSFEVAVAYQNGGRKKITLDSAPARASELYERLSLVAAGPEDSEILSGPPSARRLFLDLYLSQMSARYLADLTDYQKVLSQRNSALKQEMDPSPFDPLLVATGSRIMQERAGFIETLAERAAAAYSDIAGGEELIMRYRPRVTVDDDAYTPEFIEKAFQAALERQAERERIMQTGLVGPHRDEIDFLIAGSPARSHGSQGQWRSAAVSLKLAVYELLTERRGSSPILLLDEIFAELDAGRTERLIRRFSGAGQLFLTTAADPPQSLLEDARRYRIDSGRIAEES